MSSISMANSSRFVSAHSSASAETSVARTRAVRALVLDGESDGPGTGSYVDQHPIFRKPIHGAPGNLFGFGPRDQDTRADEQLQAAEPGHARDVLKRFTRGAPASELEGLGYNALIEAGLGHEEHLAIHPRGRLDQPPGFRRGALDPGRREQLGQTSLEIERGGHSPSSRSFSRKLAMRLSTISSRSPSRTSGRRWVV